jgi:Putative zinc-finger
MDHDAVVRQKMTERYLLNELDPGLRDEFEQHFFDCQDCALDIRAGSDLVAHSKIVLAEPSEPRTLLVATHPRPVNGEWFAWLRPAFMVPAMVLLLAVIGYQSLVIVPGLQSALQQPRVLPWASVNVGTWSGENGPTISVPQGKGFLLFVRIPPDETYSHYAMDLYGPGGRQEWSLTIPIASSQATSQQDQWPVQVPAANREAGSYTLAVRGITAAGGTKKIGQVSFELQIQK